MTSDAEGAPPLDLSLLDGFSFSCRPGCGLCCYTSPRLDSADERQLRSVAPQLRVFVAHGERCVAARPDGGACQFLRATTCGVHAARPAPCREFPVSVHVGLRVQATVVLSCPGVELAPLLSRQNARTAAGSRGFEHEVESVRRRLTPAVGRQVREAERRRRKLARQLERDDRWADEASARAQLQGQRLTPSDADYDPEEPPDAESPPELLPIYFDGRAGPVALSRALGGWEARELSPEGGGRTLGVLAPPARRPSLDREAEELLEAYLRYVLDRDSFLAAVQWELFAGRRGDVLSAALEDLRTIGSVVMARAAVRSQAAGSVPTQLGRPEIEQGIRATDFDWLDRPTWGIRL